PERHWPDPVEQLPVQDLDLVCDFTDYRHALAHTSGRPVGKLSCKLLKRGNICFDPEKARTNLVMKFGGHIAPLVILHGHQTSGEPPIVGLDGRQPIVKRIEAVRDADQFFNARAGEAMPELSFFKLA